MCERQGRGKRGAKISTVVSWGKVMPNRYVVGVLGVQEFAIYPVNRSVGVDAQFVDHVVGISVEAIKRFGTLTERRFGAHGADQRCDMETVHVQRGAVMFERRMHIGPFQGAP